MALVIVVFSSLSQSPEMNAQDLEAFTQFLRMSEQHKKKPSFFESFKAKAAISVGLFAAAIAVFENFGFTLEWI